MIFEQYVKLSKPAQVHHKVTPGTFEVDLVDESNDIDMMTPRRTISAHGHGHVYRGSSAIPISMPLRNPLNILPPDRRQCLDLEDEYDISHPYCEDEKNNDSEDYHDVDEFLDSTPASVSQEATAEKSSKPHLDDFELLSVIGRGAYGKVISYIIRHNLTDGPDLLDRFFSRREF